MKALVIVDVQNDFLSGGALAVPDGDAVIPIINQLMKNYPLVVATQDWHPKKHISFASSHRGHQIGDQIVTPSGRLQHLWSDHCVQNSFGAELSSQLNTKAIAEIFQKGTHTEADSYSGFFDSDKRPTELHRFLAHNSVTEIDLCGLAGDYCVYFTAHDALWLGYRTTILKTAIRNISDERFASLAETFEKQGGRIV